jgi:hypothetical protein
VIFDAASHLGLMTYEHMWIFTKNAIESQLYNNYKYTHFPMGSMAIWSNYSADGLCDTIIADSMRLWANAVESYVLSTEKSDLSMIVPQTKCWSSMDMNMSNIKYQYGKEFHRFGQLYLLIFSNLLIN